MDTLSNRYVSLIVEWNAKFNLTGLKVHQEISDKLYADSLNTSKAIDLEKPLKMIDIGCGAGFPGIPLKIEHPSIELTLVDSVNKKIKFVQHVIDELKLDKTNAVCARAEELGQDPKYREKFDVCVSRAVAELRVLCEYCLPFVKVGGLFIAVKGPDIDKEISAATRSIATLGGKLKEKIKVASGYLIVIKKTKPTPNDYPRPAGTPSKKPL